MRNRLGVELGLLMPSPSTWLLLNRSTALYSDGFRAWPLALPGVEGGRLARDGEDATDDVDVVGDGGPFGMVLGSKEVTTLGGFLTR